MLKFQLVIILDSLMARTIDILLSESELTEF